MLVFTALLFFLILAMYIFYIRKEDTTLFTMSELTITSHAGDITPDQWHIDDSHQFSGDFLTVEGLSFPEPGIYRIYLEFDCDTYLESSVCFPSGFPQIKVNTTGIPKGDGEMYITLWVSEPVENYYLMLNYVPPGDLTIYDLSIVDTHLYPCRSLLITLIIMTVFFIIASKLQQYATRHQGKPFYRCFPDYFLCGILILIAALISSIPAFADGVILGDDTGFHLIRVEALANTLTSGEFPVRIGQYWLSDYGYASSVFYNDFFLLLPAIMRLSGFTVTESWQTFIVSINILTAAVAYISFRKCFSAPTAYLGMFLYTMVPYRLNNIYTRSAMGELIAMAFLPLILCGLYLVFTKSPDNDLPDDAIRSYGRLWRPLSIGFWGIMQSHMITCEMTGLFVIFLCVIMWKKLLRRETFLVLAKTVVCFLLLSLWFVVPLLDYMSRDSFAYSLSYGTSSLQTMGTYAANPFILFWKWGSNSTYQHFGMAHSSALGCGISLTCGFLLYLYWNFTGYLKNLSVHRQKTLHIIAFLSFLAMIMSTSLFPWRYLQRSSLFLDSLLSNIQFAFRFLAIASVLFTMLTCLLVETLGSGNKTMYRSIVPAFLTPCLITCIFYTGFLLPNRDIFTIYDSFSMGNNYIAMGEYIPTPATTDTLSYSFDSYVTDHPEMVTDYDKNHLNITMTIANNYDQSIAIELPLLYYRGYIAEAADGTTLPLEKSENGKLLLMVPSGYSNALNISFQPFWYWRLAEGITCLSWLGFVLTGNETSQLLRRFLTKSTKKREEKQ